MNGDELVVSVRQLASGDEKTAEEPHLRDEATSVMGASG